MWNTPEWQNTFHESGVIVSSDVGHASAGYVQSSYENVSIGRLGCAIAGGLGGAIWLFEDRG